MKLVNIHVSFHYNSSSNLSLVYKEEKVMSHVSSVGGMLDVMKWSRPEISHSLDVTNHMENSGEEVKWVLQCFRGTSVTYNGFSGLVCGNCNLGFAGMLDKRRFTLGYASKNCFGRHVGGGVIPQKIQT
jgi:hypothetical protein